MKRSACPKNSHCIFALQFVVCILSNVLTTTSSAQSVTVEVPVDGYGHVDSTFSPSVCGPARTLLPAEPNVPYRTCVSGSSSDSALCFAPLSTVADLRAWLAEFRGDVTTCMSAATRTRTDLELTGNSSSLSPACGSLVSKVRNVQTVDGLLDSSTSTKAAWHGLRLAGEQAIVDIGTSTNAATTENQRAALGALVQVLARVDDRAVELTRQVVSRLSSQRDKVVRVPWSCYDNVYELPIICPPGRASSSQRQQINGVELETLSPAAHAQACIDGSSTFVVDYLSPAANTTNFGEPGPNVRWMVLLNVPPVAQVTVLSRGDRRTPALAAAALAFRLAGNVPSLPELDDATGEPRRARSRGRIRVMRLQHDRVDEVDITMSEPGRSRTHQYLSMPTHDISFGAALSLDLALQSASSGPFGRVTNVDGAAWQADGILDDDADTQLVPGMTVHLFIGQRVRDYLWAFETPLVSTTGNPFRGFGFRFGRRTRRLSSVLYWSGSIGLRIQRRPDIPEMHMTTSDLPETRSIAGYLSLGLAFDLRAGLDSILPK